jgi:hypothetical protein
MKTIGILFTLALMWPVIGCHQDASSPVAPLVASGNGAAQIPDPELVPFGNIPFPFPPNLYRIAGHRLADGPVAVLESVLDAGFDMQPRRCSSMS